MEGRGGKLLFISLCTCSSVHIGLEASMETDVTLLVSYVVANASWSPAYDVRVFPVTKEMKVGLSLTFYLQNFESKLYNQSIFFLLFSFESYFYDLLKISYNSRLGTTH